MDAKFKFIPLQFNWVAIHPKPIGVVQFIGGAFFGTFPTIFYRYILRRLFEQGYTIIALPYRFTFRHWSVAIGLVKELRELRKAILEEAKRLGYDYNIYEEDPTSEKGNYFWLAHSLGNKYIALLELLSDLEKKKIQEVLGECVGEDQYQEIEDCLRGVDLKEISLRNQPSILMAPAITGIESAIPISALADFIKGLGFDVKPTVEQTYCLIKCSRLFNLIGLIAFQNDDIARETVSWLLDKKNLPKGPAEFAELPGGHLAPLDFSKVKSKVANEVIEFLTKLQKKL
ncbi:MAG: DUF1350 family protein [Xenococcaceae cyanobacterium]